MIYYYSYNDDLCRVFPKSGTSCYRTPRSPSRNSLRTLKPSSMSSSITTHPHAILRWSIWGRTLPPPPISPALPRPHPYNKWAMVQLFNPQHSVLKFLFITASRINLELLTSTMLLLLNSLVDSINRYLFIVNYNDLFYI